MRNGFTLVEILVVIAIVAIIGTLLVAIFTSTLRGSNKAQVLAVIKQNGQAVLENMDKTIRVADNVLCVDPYLVVASGDDYTRYKFEAPTLTANGLIKQDKPLKGSDSQGVGETEDQFKKRVCSSGDPMTPETKLVILTDTNALTGVSVTRFSPTRDNQGGSKDIVSVLFDLDHAVKMPAGLASQIDPVTFQTTIELRN